MSVDPDSCQRHTFPEGLCCGDCATINRVYLAAYLPRVRTDRAHWTVLQLDRYPDSDGVTA